MVAYHAELLETAERLVTRAPGQSGRLPAARIRRSISTCYYAIFHFLVDDACRRLVGHRHMTRRRIVARVFTHGGVKSTLSKIRGKAVEANLASFMQPSGDGGATTSAPAFARGMASVFIDAQSKRHSADYDLNEQFSETDARKLHKDCGDAIHEWRHATEANDRDFKNALALVMLMKGQLRREG